MITQTTYKFVAHEERQQHLLTSEASMHILLQFRLMLLCSF